MVQVTDQGCQGGMAVILQQSTPSTQVFQIELFCTPSRYLRWQFKNKSMPLEVLSTRPLTPYFDSMYCNNGKKRKNSFRCKSDPIMVLNSSLLHPFFKAFLDVWPLQLASCGRHASGSTLIFFSIRFHSGRSIAFDSWLYSFASEWHEHNTDSSKMKVYSGPTLDCFQSKIRQCSHELCWKRVQF